MKIKTILLNALITVPSEEGQKKIDDALEKEILGTFGVFKDEHGHTREFYEDVAGKVPKHFEEEEREFYKNNSSSKIDEDGNIFLQESEIEELTVPMFIPLDNIDSFVATLDGTTRVYTKSGIVYNVAEDVFEIDSYIELLSMSWWEKLKLSFQSFLRRKQKYNEDILDKEIE
ncbi:hypothetical protein [Flavobacterium sp.]|jgi:hypothetical protein|uniref:hypothetical protein n=1 Tax=Flavobacterium sp. TaxID=239 RepID=UPI0037C0CE4F